MKTDYLPSIGSGFYRQHTSDTSRKNHMIPSGRIPRKDNQQPVILKWVFEWWLAWYSARKRAIIFFLFWSTTHLSLHDVAVTAFLTAVEVPSLCSRPCSPPKLCTKESREYLYLQDRIQRLPSTNCRATYLTAKSDSTEESIEEDNPSSSFPFSGLFKRSSETDGNESKAPNDGYKKSSKGLSVMGWILNVVKNSEDADEDVESEMNSSRVRSVVSRYLQSRRRRKDAEILREEVLRREEEKQMRIAKQLKAVEEGRKRGRVTAGVTPRDIRQEEVKREVERLRRIESQKVVDLQRLERLEKIRLEREIRQKEILPGENDQSKLPVSSSVLRIPSSNAPSKNAKAKSKSTEADQSKGEKKTKDALTSKGNFNVVSVAQKFVTGFFEKEEEWIVVAPKTKISPGELVPVTVAGLDLLLVASKDGTALHCIANSCPHLGTPLEIGTLERRPIEYASSTTLDGNATASSTEGVGVLGVPFFQENDITRMLKQDGCEECIVCPLHRTAFALESGEVRGEWCPYPPIIGKLTGAIKQEANLPVFDVRTRGKNIEVRLNSPVIIGFDENKKTTKDKKQQTR